MKGNSMRFIIEYQKGDKNGVAEFSNYVSLAKFMLKLADNGYELIGQEIQQREEFGAKTTYVIFKFMKGEK